MNKMSGHTSFSQFRIRREDSIVKLQMKDDKLESEWKFPAGINLLNEPPSDLKFEVAPFREESDW